jgi:hypothetical protein
MDKLINSLEELRLSQARHRGFESLHPLFFQKHVSSTLDLSLEEPLLFVLD